MAERKHGVFSALNAPRLYEVVQSALGAPTARVAFLRDYCDVHPGQRVLDVGCGPADILQYLPPVEYVGCEPDPGYVDYARRRYGTRGCFVCGTIAHPSIHDSSPYDLVMVMSVLHHLSDSDAADLIRSAVTMLKPSGRLVTMDPCRTERQPMLNRWLVNSDRGRNIRDPEAYVELFGKSKGRVETSVRSDLMHVPYTHMFMVYRHDGSSGS